MVHVWMQTYFSSLENVTASSWKKYGLGKIAKTKELARFAMNALKFLQIYIMNMGIS